jgi:galactokinase
MYIVHENDRVNRACEYVRAGDLSSFGRLMFESHDGLRDEYQVSCTELDTLVDAAKTIDGVFGARMMGAGFGGCTINLVENQNVEAFENIMRETYQNKLGKDMKVHICSISGGTERLKV